MILLLSICAILILFTLLLIRHDMQEEFKNVEIVNGDYFQTLPKQNIIVMRTRDVNVADLDRIKVPSILLTIHDDDNSSTIPNYEKILNNPKIIAWFAMHNNIKHPKVHSLPLGLNYRGLYGILSVYRNKSNRAWGKWASPTMQERQLLKIKKSLPPLKNRPLVAYTTANFNNTSIQRNDKYRYSRRDMVRALKGKPYIITPNKPIPRLQSWKDHGRCSFVLCPFGIGLDSYRTWEALNLDTIPILQTSPLDPLFEDLPVVIIKDWNEVCPENMRKWKAEILSKSWNMNKLKVDYWKNKFNNILSEFEN